MRKLGQIVENAVSIMNNYVAIVIAEDHYNAMGMLRSLSASKLPIKLVLIAEHEHYVDKSRYLKETIVVKKSKEAVLAALNKLLCSDEHGILFPLSDYAANILDENYELLSGRATVPNMKGNMHLLLDKEQAKMHAQTCGLRTPRGRSVYLDNVALTLRSEEYPIIVKPLASIDGAKSDIRIAGNADQLRNIFVDMQHKGYERVLVEQYICGDDEHMIEVMGYAANGEVTISGIISKIREFPIKNGSTSYANVVEEHVDIDPMKISRFVSECSFDGLFDMEFKYAAGKAYFIECNFRNGAPGFALTCCGRNIPCGWMQKHLDIEFKEKPRKNLLFMCEQNDLLNMLKGEVAVLQWIRQFFRAKKIFFDSKDMKPYLHYYWLLIKGLWNRKK